MGVAPTVLVLLAFGPEYRLLRVIVDAASITAGLTAAVGAHAHGGPLDGRDTACQAAGRRHLHVLSTRLN
jgi:hypothetical protein